MLTIALLASAKSIHTIRWANGLAESDVQVILMTQHPHIDQLDSRVISVRLPYSGAQGYVLNAPFIRAYLKKNKVDVVHAHFALGYATLARLVGIRPWMVSVMGTDVDELPNRNRLFGYLIRGNLRSASLVTVSSQHLKQRVSELVSDIAVMKLCRYGVSESQFKPMSSTALEGRPFTFGTVKMLEHVYGIDRLILAFRQFLDQFPEDHWSEYALRIVGDGSMRHGLTAMVKELNLSSYVTFVPAVKHEDVPVQLQQLDVYMALSRREGFGVAIAEAGMMGLPVIAANVGGIPEIVEDGVSGFLVDADDLENIVDKMNRYVGNNDLRDKHRTNLSEHIFTNFKWSDSLSSMIRLYKSVVCKD